MSLTVGAITFLCILLLVAGMTLFISKSIKVPYTILLVVVGYLIACLASYGPEFLHPFANYRINPDIILFACLPTLIFESAFTMDAKLLRLNITPVLVFAILGLFLSTALIGVIVWLLTPVSFLIALLLGAILSATDPVAVISLFKQLGVPKRLTILVEGESLFNDSTAIVTAKTILFILLAGSVTTGTVLHGMERFAIEFFGGIIAGIVMTYIAGKILEYTEEEPTVGLSITIILAYLSFIVADKLLHVSGVMATITAGIMMAGWGRTKLSAKVELQLRELLEFFSYVANALIFLLVGLSINLTLMVDASYVLMITIIAMLISRAAVIYGLTPLLGMLPRAESIDLRYQTIMWWGGLRGAIAIAIVFGLTNIPDQSLLEALVMGSVLFTILVQGLSIKKLIHWLGLDRPLLFDRFTLLEAEVAAEQVALTSVPVLQGGGMFSLKIAEQASQHSEKAIAWRHKQLDSLRASEMTLQDERRILFLGCFSVEKALYYEMFAKGHLSEQAYRTLNQGIEIEMDLMRTSGQVPDRGPSGFIKKIYEAIMSFLECFPWLRPLADRLRIARTINDYEEAWGLHQGGLAAMAYLDEVQKLGSFDTAVITEARQCFQRWLASTRRFLDEMAEQFPEFVNDMQRRLAKRLILHAKRDALEHEVQKGILPKGVVEPLIEKYEHSIQLLRKHHPEKLKLDVRELLHRVPFFRHIPLSEVDQVMAMLEERHITAGRLIITEGDTEDTMYLIIRGVVRVLKRQEGGVELEVATLMAGDFFGEMALIYDVKRTASCAAVTPCQVFVVKRSVFDELCQRYPAIRDDIMREAARRVEK